MRTLGIIALLIALTVTACGTEPDGSTTTPTLDEGSVTTSPVTTSPVTTGPAANDLAAFDRIAIEIDGESFEVAVADTPDARAQGLMGVTELVEVDGMLFVFDEDTAGAFWMKDTLIPLDIWFFDADGDLVSMTTMVPCEADPCEIYEAEGEYRFALETEVGRLESAELLDTASIAD